MWDDIPQDASLPLLLVDSILTGIGLLISLIEFIRTEIFKSSFHFKDKLYFQFTFHLFLPLSFLFRFLSLLIYMTPVSPLNEQKPSEILISASSGYFFVACFISLVLHWILALKSNPYETSKPPIVYFFIIGGTCFIFPLIFVILLFVIEQDDPDLYNNIHTWEITYYLILNICVSIGFLISGGVLLRRISILRSIRPLIKLRQKIFLQMLTCLIFFIARAALLAIRAFINVSTLESQCVSFATSTVGEFILAIVMLVLVNLRVHSPPTSSSIPIRSKAKKGYQWTPPADDGDHYHDENDEGMNKVKKKKLRKRTRRQSQNHPKNILGTDEETQLIPA